MVVERFRWEDWEALIRANGVTIDRPLGSAHPDYPEIIYPIDYGFINDTTSSDDHEVDVFVGTVSTGLVGAIQTVDHRRGDREMKLLWNCSPEEIYRAHGFINFDRALLEGRLFLRYPMRELWEKSGWKDSGTVVPGPDRGHEAAP
jgi:inorganic pyrophosphatase